MMQIYDYNKDEIKEGLDFSRMMDILAELGAEPIPQGERIITCKTICHCGDSHKLWYWTNTGLFKCFTDCGGEAFDIFELVYKVKSREYGEGFQLPQAIDYVARYFGYAPIEREDSNITTTLDWKILNGYSRINYSNEDSQQVTLKEYSGKILYNLPKPKIKSWIDDNISVESMKRFEICYEPKNQSIIIPHRDMAGRLIGIRQRTLIDEQAELYGKYRPANIGGVMYNHPLGYNLYGLYQNLDAIKRIKKVIVFESEKSVLQLDSILGSENNIGVACCGSSFVSYQFLLLKSIGVEEIIIAFDRQFKELNDSEHKKLVKNLRNIQTKYGNYIKINFIFDINMITPYKASPSDCGTEIFFKLLNERKNIYDETRSK